MRYKVVEVAQVDEGTLEQTLNEWVQRGWHFDGLQFVMRESSRRPSMAFMFFTQTEELDQSRSMNAPKTAEYSHGRIEDPTRRAGYRRLRELAGKDGEDINE